MSGILNRTVFFAKGGDGIYRGSDWARVVTEIGTCFEARPLQPRLTVGDADGYEASDMISRIDHIGAYDPASQRFGDDGCIGGGLVPVLNY